VITTIVDRRLHLDAGAATEDDLAQVRSAISVARDVGVTEATMPLSTLALLIDLRDRARRIASPAA
jgi:hypothetical protein